MEKLRFGIVVVPEHPRTDDVVKRVDELVEQARAVDELGLDSVWAGQHYLSDVYSYLQPIPLLSRIANEAPNAVIGTSVILLNLQHPVRVAEEIATLDAITGGRTVLGVGLGYRELEFQVLGQPREDRVATFEESIGVIRRLWSEDEIQHDGRFFRIPFTALATHPVQRPGPPIWMAANANGAVRRAARLADAWFVNNHSTVETLVKQMRMYRNELDRVNKPFPEELPIIKELYVSRDHDQAVTDVAPYIQAKYKVFQDWGQDGVIPEPQGFNMSFDELKDDRFIIGGVDFCVEEIRRHIELLGVNHFVFRVQWPGMPQDLVLRSLEILATDVIPKVRTSQAQGSTSVPPAEATS